MDCRPGIAAQPAGAARHALRLTPILTFAEIPGRRQIRALARGIFGSPTVVIDSEPFWGVQSLEPAARWLETGGW
jgi:2-hydroxychromene-2-carboxylate isomerase